MRSPWSVWFFHRFFEGVLVEGVVGVFGGGITTVRRVGLAGALFGGDWNFYGGGVGFGVVTDAV